MAVCRYSIVLILLSFLTISLKAQLTYKELQVLYDSPWTFKNLQLIPIKFKPVSQGAGIADAAVLHPVSLAEAMEKYKVKVREVKYENGADVNLLKVTNRSKQDVVVQSGEIVEGGKQDRMVGETKVIAAGSTDYMKVFCIEKRRWDNKPKKFTTNGVANSEVRKSMLSGRQNNVWKEIDRQFKAEKKESETQSYIELYKAFIADTSYLNYFTRRYHNGDSNYAGFIFITGDRILSTEIFATPALLEMSFTNMLNSYIQTAIKTGASPTVDAGRQKAFLDKVLLNESAQKIYVTAHGKFFKNEGKLIHLIAYPE
jgi:hypothetical protein